MALSRSKMDTLRLLRQSATEHLVHHQALLGDGSPETVLANVRREIDIWSGKAETLDCTISVIEGENGSSPKPDKEAPNGQGTLAV